MQRLLVRSIPQRVPLAGFVVAAIAVLFTTASPRPTLLTLAGLDAAVLLLVWIAAATLLTRFCGASSLAAELPDATGEFHALTRFSAVVHLENCGPRPALLLRVVLRTTAGGHVLPSPPIFLDSLAPRTSKLCQWLITARMRGTFELTSVSVRTCFPGSLIEQEAVLQLGRNLLVLPAIYHLTPRILDLLHGRRMATARLQTIPASEEEFAGVRLYRPGDNPRHIHLGLSQRMAGYPFDLVLREYDDPGANDICVVLDNTLLPEETNDLALHYRREKALSFATALCLLLCERKYHVRFVTCDAANRVVSVSMVQSARDLPRLRALAARLQPCTSAAPLQTFLRHESHWGNALLIYLSLRDSVPTPAPVLVFTPDSQSALVQEVVSA
jgi:uncharacterized protein (DUF58 family)